MTILVTEARRRMNRHSDEAVAAVVLAAITQLRSGSAGPSLWDGVPPEVQAVLAERIRLIRAGVLPREQYERARDPDDPPYSELSVQRRDEDQVEWMLTQALTGD